MKVLILALALIILASSCNKGLYLSGHTCNYPHCPYKGIKTFSKETAEFPDYPASYTLDSVHFAHPELTYDQEIELLEANNICIDDMNEY
jgi:hypothetical protein